MCVSNSVTLWTVAHQVPLSMGFSRQEYWSGLPFPSPGDLPNPRIKPASPAHISCIAGRRFSTAEPVGKRPQESVNNLKILNSTARRGWEVADTLFNCSHYFFMELFLVFTLDMKNMNTIQIWKKAPKLKK